MHVSAVCRCRVHLPLVGFPRVAYLRRMRFLLSIALLLATGPAFAQAFTAGDLQRMCGSRAQPQAMACAFYIQGYLTGRNLSPPKPTICVPQGASIADAVKGFGEHMSKNPLEVRIDAGLVLGNYLLTTYPCR